jgi:hypothetical protein
MVTTNTQVVVQNVRRNHVVFFALQVSKDGVKILHHLKKEQTSD